MTDALHLGGGITDQNALDWLESGAEKVRGEITAVSAGLTRNRSSSRPSSSLRQSSPSNDSKRCRPKSERNVSSSM